MVGPSNLGDDSIPGGPRRKKRRDPLKPGTEQFQKRQARHRHNSFSGAVAMAKSGMWAIEGATTTTPRAKLVARDIIAMLEVLAEELKTRVD